jgi:predicted N-acyltransferase
VHEDSLHFEACYYQGIEHCIACRLDAFDPGTQGEHKLARGFEPTLTQSAHWLAHDGFATAIARYLERERAAVEEYLAAAADHLPFQRGPAP